MSASPNVPAAVRGAAAGVAAVVIPVATIPVTALACILAMLRADDGARTQAALVAFGTVLALVLLSHPGLLLPS